MQNETLFIAGIIIGLLVGIGLSSFFHPKIRHQRKLKQELDSTQKALVKQREELVKHFSDSAELLDKMANDFRNLYQHMADNSTSLLNNDNLSLETEDPFKLTNRHHTKESSENKISQFDEGTEIEENNIEVKETTNKIITNTDSVKNQPEKEQ